MFSFILFRRNINYLLPRLLNIRKPDILPRIINCYDVHAYMPQHQYSASYVYIITVFISFYNILKDKISNLTTYTCVTASTDLSAFPYSTKKERVIKAAIHIYTKWLNTAKEKFGFDLVFGLIVFFLNSLTHSVLGC